MLSFECMQTSFLTRAVADLVSRWGSRQVWKYRMANRHVLVMKTPLLTVLALLAVCACTDQDKNRRPNEEAEFASFLKRWETAQDAFINGDPTEWKVNASHSPDSTIFGGFGGYEKGWDQVGQRYDWASSQFQASNATKTVEYLSTGVSDGLAFSVSIERSQVRTGAQGKASELALRVTQIFRRENGSWKLLHRHADPMVEKKTPGP
jgi:ketosteroid isomerase-like protein